MSRDLGGFVALQVRVFLGDDVRGAFDGLGEHVGELHVVAGAGLHQLAVLAEDRTEGDVLEIPGFAPARGGFEDLAEMQLLRHADDIPDLVRLPFVDAELDRGEVGGGVEESAVGLADDGGVVGPAVLLVDHEGIVLGLFGAVREDADRAVALAGDAFG